MLIANPSTLLTPEYLTTMNYRLRNMYIKNAGLSSKAKELYASVFKADISKIYLGNYADDYKAIWETILSPYLMTNAEKMDLIFYNRIKNLET